MKARKIYSLIIGYLCLVIAGFSLPVSSLAQTEPCSVEINATCNGSTDCSGVLAGGTDIKNAGTDAITCQVVVNFGSGAVGDEITLLPQEQKGLGFWIDMPTGDIPFWDFRPIAESGTSTADCYVTDNPETMCKAYEEWGCSATCDPTPVTVDSKISSISLKGKWLSPIVIIGADNFDVTAVDTATIRLGRDGVRDMVFPLRWSYKNDDLSLKFNKSEVINNLKLRDVAGREVQLFITGKLKDEFGKTPFMGTVGVWVVK